MKDYLYYTISRPPVPGTIPGGALSAGAFSDRAYIPEIERMAWGWAIYERPLTPAEIAEFNMISAPAEEEREG